MAAWFRKGLGDGRVLDAPGFNPRPGQSRSREREAVRSHPGYVALHDALTRLVVAGTIKEHALSDLVAAVSVGIIGGIPMLDLPYEEDSRAGTDMNVVMTGSGRFVEVQGTAEQEAFSREELDLAATGIAEIHEAQRLVLATPPVIRSK